MTITAQDLVAREVYYCVSPPGQAIYADGVMEDIAAEVNRA